MRMDTSRVMTLQKKGEVHSLEAHGQEGYIDISCDDCLNIAEEMLVALDMTPEVAIGSGVIAAHSSTRDLLDAIIARRNGESEWN